MSTDIVTQTRNALIFVKKLHTEISYLIKEIEGLLLEEAERFLILKPGGYQVTARTSNGLDSAGVDLWMPKDFTIFFCPEEFIDSNKSTTATYPKENLKILFFQIKLIDNDINEPKIFYGFFDKILFKKEHFKKVEQMVGDFTYSGNKIFSNPPNIDFQNSYWSFKGKFEQKNLLSINSSKNLKQRIVNPALKLYRKG
ncbi:MAG: hypothetical protein K8S14_09895 [Actinomycetia bacterium]|nr:hypothetical protein [Actinomycetes bacterium]